VPAASPTRTSRTSAALPAPAGASPAEVAAAQPLSYAAVGATQAPDLMYFPPRGFRPMQARARLGSGEARFEKASARLMAWGVQRGAGITVGDVAPPAPTETDYAGLRYDGAGQPIGPRSVHPEQAYGEDGTPLVSAGTTAVLTIRAFGLRVHAPIRVVYLVDEPGRRGFAYGTLPGHPEAGEESFVVEHLSDDSVWIVIRAFSRPSTWFYRLGMPVLRFMQCRYTKRYLRSLTPGAAASGR
jgi:uncharacterized protein (UPF0548 family)